jgi:hypothetical protein
VLANKGMAFMTLRTRFKQSLKIVKQLPTNPAVWNIVLRIVVFVWDRFNDHD